MRTRRHTLRLPHPIPAVRQDSSSDLMYVRPGAALSSRSFQRHDHEEVDQELFIRDRQGYPPLRRPYHASSARDPSPDGQQIVIVNLPEDSDPEESGEPRFVVLVPTNQAGLLSTEGPQTESDFRVATPSILPVEQGRGRPFYANYASESSDEFLAPLKTKR